MRVELRTLETVQARYRALSVADAEALVIARADNAVLLAGDGSLRKAAPDAGVDVRGVIGELRRLVAAVVIDPPGAQAALESIVASARAATALGCSVQSVRRLPPSSRWSRGRPLSWGLVM